MTTSTSHSQRLEFSNPKTPRGTQCLPWGRRAVHMMWLVLRSIQTMREISAIPELQGSNFNFLHFLPCQNTPSRWHSYKQLLARVDLAFPPLSKHTLQVTFLQATARRGRRRLKSIATCWYNLYLPPSHSRKHIRTEMNKDTITLGSITNLWQLIEKSKSSAILVFQIMLVVHDLWSISQWLTWRFTGMPRLRVSASLQNPPLRHTV